METVLAITSVSANERGECLNGSHGHHLRCMESIASFWMMSWKELRQQLEVNSKGKVAVS